MSEKGTLPSTYAYTSNMSVLKAIPSSHHFFKENHVVSSCTRLTLIETIQNTIDTKNILKKRENFHIKILETLHPYRLNQKLHLELN